MASREREISSHTGHNYQDVNVCGKVQLGDTYHFGEFVPDVARKHSADCEQDLNSPLNCLPFSKDASFNSSPGNTNLLVSLITAFMFERYTTGMMDKMSGASFRSTAWPRRGIDGCAHTVARQYYDQKRLWASVFFSRGDGDAGHASKFITTIALQVVARWNQLVSRPLSQLSRSSALHDNMLALGLVLGEVIVIEFRS